MRFLLTGFIGLFMSLPAPPLTITDGFNLISDPCISFGVFCQQVFSQQHIHPESFHYAEWVKSLAAVSSHDSLLFLEKQKTAAQQSTTNGKSLAIARSFLGTPYVTGTLDVNETEHLVVNLRQLDCWTLVENSIAIALTPEGDFPSYLAHLQELRYWGGTLDGYGSRIHYFSGWLLQAEKSGLLRD
ncbi:MAG TPA: DUF1460 domain-containing protein, partial [Saprospiraceae bacterium]|nr:DUF1460 domain-containing protein [Saprospiraceae bacterium]